MMLSKKLVAVLGGGLFSLISLFGSTHDAAFITSFFVNTASQTKELVQDLIPDSIKTQTYAAMINDDKYLVTMIKQLAASQRELRKEQEAVLTIGRRAYDLEEMMRMLRDDLKLNPHTSQFVYPSSTYGKPRSFSRTELEQDLLRKARELENIRERTAAMQETVEIIEQRCLALRGEIDHHEAVRSKAKTAQAKAALKKMIAHKIEDEIAVLSGKTRPNSTTVDAALTGIERQLEKYEHRAEEAQLYIEFKSPSEGIDPRMGQGKQDAVSVADALLEPVVSEAMPCEWFSQYPCR